MECQVESQPGETKVRITGRLSFEDYDRFFEIINEIKGNPGGRVILDLARLEFIDSAGLGMFLVARDVVAKIGLSLRIRQPNGLVAKVMTLVNYASEIPVDG